MRKVVFAAIFAFSTACSDGIVGSSTVTGDYRLVSINGSPLPYATANTSTTKTEIVDDVITLYEGFTYAEVIHSRVTANGQATNATMNKAGAYSLLGNSIAFAISTGGPPRYATITADVMTMVDAGLTSVFKK